MATIKSTDSEQRKFRGDPLTLKRLRVAAGLTVKEFTELSGLDRATVGKMLRGDPVFLKSLSIASKNVFDIDDVTLVLHPQELNALGVDAQPPNRKHVLEWEVEDYLSGWNSTANGLQYQISRLRHRYLNGRFARAKCFELRHLSGSEKVRVEDQLHRHVDVCQLVGVHSNLAKNLTAALFDDNWWVLDEWEGSESLTDRLDANRLSEYELRIIMTGLAEGLAAVHKANIVLRELTPTNIMLREQNDSPIIADMELAKLSGTNPSVSPDEWPANTYRALEVDGDSPVDQRADVYSWGRIFIHAATGELPLPGEEQPLNIDVPENVNRLVLQSVRVSRSQRPENMKQVLRTLSKWI